MAIYFSQEKRGCPLKVRLAFTLYFVKRLVYGETETTTTSRTCHIISELYPAQQDNFETSLSNVSAVSFIPSAIVKYGARVSFKSSTVKPNLTTNVAA